MAKKKVDVSVGILEYALTHLERERDEILTKIDHIRRQLFGGSLRLATAEPSTAAPAAAAPRKKRVLSEAARKRIAAAQKRRWAEHRKAKAKAE